VGCEHRVLEEPAGKTGHLILAHGQIDQTVSWVTEGSLVEPITTGEKGRSRELVEQSDDGVIREPSASHLAADLTHWNPPTAQELPLMLGNILVEEIHPAMSASSWVNKASRAKRTASPMASLLTSPRQSSTIASQAMPVATCSKTSATKMRVPTNVGLPWQIAGSATM
jgi:hypothetical protein